jgi:hypothetical protein
MQPPERRMQMPKPTPLTTPANLSKSSKQRPSARGNLPAAPHTSSDIPLNPLRAIAIYAIDYTKHFVRLTGRERWL